VPLVRITVFHNPHDFVGTPDQAELQRRRDLACRDADPAMFEIDGDERVTANQRRIAAAKAVCGRCPAKVQCQNEAIADDTDAWTVRGGLSPQERVELRRRLGWAPPLAWNDIDDPDEVPDAGAPADDEADENVVHAFLAGRPPRWSRMTDADRELLVRELRRLGYTRNAIVLATRTSYRHVRPWWEKVAA
jgi:WhiB family transcriptional regulator, redox-sensing transcriptional regulator